MHLIAHKTSAAFVLQSVKDMPILQDAPPPGGFPSIRIDRRFGAAGPTGIAIFGK
jgi:NADH dehydrogenase (ubiquinone) 1 alpha subcomplex subunit 13